MTEAIESLDDFLRDVQARALRMARLATRDADEALDLVQDAMTAFVRRYRHKPADQRRALFHRCLHNRIVDWHRKRARRGRWVLPWLHRPDAGDDDPQWTPASPPGQEPEHDVSRSEFAAALERALERLPLRQRQVFLLRAWEGMDVAETASALGIGAGSVKTHYFRALGALRETLETFDE